MKITGSGVCDRMQYIDPKVYIDMNDGVVMEMYNNLEEMETFKGFHVFAIDGSFVELPDHPQTREEMEIPPDTQLKSYVARAKISCMVDAKMDFVVSSKIENQFVVGFGLDYNGYYRNLPYIGILKESVYKK